MLFWTVSSRRDGGKLITVFWERITSPDALAQGARREVIAYDYHHFVLRRATSARLVQYQDGYWRRSNLCDLSHKGILVNTQFFAQVGRLRQPGKQVLWQGKKKAHREKRLKR